VTNRPVMSSFLVLCCLLLFSSCCIARAPIIGNLEEFSLPTQTDNGTEYIPADEAANIDAVFTIFSESMAAQYSEGDEWLRQAHAKQHGCARGYLIVNAGLPSPLDRGIFNVSSTTYYPVLMRFSNGVGRGFSTSDPHESDSKFDTRGIALKLFQVPGVKLVQPDAETQDFLFTTSRNGFLSNGDNALGFFAAVSKGNLALAAFLAIHPILAAELVKVGLDGDIDNMLTGQFWIQASARLGYMATKMSLTPCATNGLLKSQKDQSDPNFLRTNLMAGLQSSETLCYTLAVQFFQDEDSTPVEDPTVEWDTPFYPVATLSIPTPQYTDSDGQEAFCREMSMNPWHSLEAHRPIGFLQRFRNVVYTGMGSQRHADWGQSNLEPTYADWQAFPNL